MVTNTGRNFIKLIWCDTPVRPLKSFLNLNITVRHINTRKRFYEKVNIIQNEGKYEIVLDNRKLKTPAKNLLYVNNEPLALSVAAEWDAQKHEISTSTMHLTGLCNTVIDNPSKKTKEEIARELVGYVEADTILFFSEEDELYHLQKKEWLPVISWFCEKFKVDITPVTHICGPAIKPEAYEVIHKYFLSYDLWSLFGYSFAIEALKSVILGISCRERHITVEQAVFLSRLEEEYQAKRWGEIAWAHGMNKYDIQARVAAGIFFVQVNSSSTLVKTKIQSKKSIHKAAEEELA